MPSRWFMPSEKVPTRWPRDVAEPGDLEHFAHPAAEMPLLSASHSR